MHAKINEQKGYQKLANRMLEEYEDEMDSVAEVIKHIRRLGGIPLHKTDHYTIYPNIEDQIRHEAELQKEGVAALEQMIRSTELDLATENFLSDYFDEEVEHAEWLDRQVSLLNELGSQIYLEKQI